MANHDDDTNTVSGKTEEKSSRTPDDGKKSINHRCELFLGGEGKCLEGREFELLSLVQKFRSWETPTSVLPICHPVPANSRPKQRPESRHKEILSLPLPLYSWFILGDRKLEDFMSLPRA